ncbi:fimbrial protein [Ewingella americana]|jgi:type 1 fimbria pilin|uniref:Fimbrial adhesin n=2 Tax=Ewingella americana TaxID=41202 RepID=A0A085GIM3_EWIA3|nr:fimbrial protein [Ewingella americana]KAA8729326.1 fimbrial protein [Ewingella americana]KFC83568.1 fimbrial adhesin [Ewingella americana ATCC 33852]STQ45239.1 putative major fimbrial protein SthE [Ewingella americana]
MKSYQKIIVLISLLFMSLDVAAYCTRAAGTSALVWTVSPGTVVVKGSDPIGTPVYTKSLSSSQAGKTFIRCSEGETFYINMLTGSPVAGMTNVFSSNVPGIGIKVTDAKGRAVAQPGIAFPTQPDVFTVLDFTPFTFELIKTAIISQGGTLDSGMFMGLVGPGLADGDSLKALMGTATIQPSNVCTVNNPVIQTDMGSDVSRYDFKGVGKTLQEKDITIGLTCDQFAKVSIQFDATSVPNNPDIIALNSSSKSASGFGIQLLDKRNNNPIQLATPLLITDNADQGGLDMQFIARYYQTEDRVEGGEVNATASFTMTYQ